MGSSPATFGIMDHEEARRKRTGGKHDAFAVQNGDTVGRPAAASSPRAVRARCAIERKGSCPDGSAAEACRRDGAMPCGSGAWSA